MTPEEALQGLENVHNYFMSLPTTRLEPRKIYLTQDEFDRFKKYGMDFTDNESVGILKPIGWN